MSVDWNFEARRLLREQLTQAGLDYADLASRLALRGTHLTAKALTNKINRGTFSLAFFLECMQALNVETVSLRKN